MVEKIVVNPEKVRGLGNVITSKSRSEYNTLGAGVVQQISSSENINNLTFTTFKIIRSNTTISASDFTGYLDSAYLAVVLKSGSTFLDDKVVTLLINGQLLSATTDEGYAYFDLTSIPAGTYVGCNINFGGDGGYSSSDKLVNVTLNKHGSALNIESNSLTVNVGNSFTLTATLTSGGSAVSGETVSFYNPDGTLITTGTTNSSGEATCSVSKSLEDSYQFKAIFDGSSSLDGSTGTISVNVERYTPTLTISNGSSSMFNDSAYVTLNCSYDNYFMIGPYHVYIDGVLYQTINTALYNKRVDVNGLDIGTHTIRVEYAGSTVYKPVTATGTFRIVDYSLTMTDFNITGTNVAGNASDYYCITPVNANCACTVTGKIILSDNTPVEGILIRVYSGNSLYNATTDSSGIFTKNISFHESEAEKPIRILIDTGDGYIGKDYGYLAFVIASNAEFECEDTIA